MGIYIQYPWAFRWLAEMFFTESIQLKISNYDSFFHPIKIFLSAASWMNQIKFIVTYTTFIIIFKIIVLILILL